MAKKKKQDATPSTSGGASRVTTAIESAENGFVVHTSSDGGPDKNYMSKTFVAPDHASALRIAAMHIASCGPKGKGKKGKGKKGKSKIATSKR
jgi:phosphoheptose isomerase